MKNLRLNEVILIIILILGFAFRLYRFNNPIADWHSWRQADTSSVSRNFVNFGFDLLHPKFDDLSNVPSGLDNPNGYRFVEFPIYNVFQAGLYKLVGFFTLEEWGRLVTIFSSILSAVFIYLIVKRHVSKTAAIFSSLFFSFLPYNIYFGRTLLPESSMVMAILGGIYFFNLWIDENSKSSFKNYIFLFISILFTASALLLKPYALFFTLPIIYLAYKRFGLSLFTKWQIWLFAALSVIPLIAWRLWMQQFPEGIPQSGWLLNGGNIRFKGAYFYWLFADRLGRLILGYWGVVFLVLGVIRKKTKEEGLFFLSFLFSSLLYLAVIARGNVQHDYYQVLIIPTLAIFMGLGAEMLLNTSKEYFSKTGSYMVFIICSIFMFSFSWYFVRDYFNINNPSIVIAGAEIDKMLPKDSKIIAIYNGDTAFLYQTKRKGWTSFEKSLPEMIKMGADYLALVNPSKDDYAFSKDYKIVSANSTFILYDLHKKP